LRQSFPPASPALFWEASFAVGLPGRSERGAKESGLFSHPREKVQFKNPDAIFAMVHRKLPSPFCACTGSAYGPSARTLVSQKSKVLRQQTRGRICASFAVAKHRCETISFCDMFCSRDSGMILFGALGKEPHIQKPP
jgi:hypothetical protein